MKNLKTKITAALVIAAILVPSLSVSAAEDNSNSKTIGSGIVRQQERLQNLKNTAEWKTYKATITSKKDTIKQNHEINQGLRKEIADKKTTIRNLKKDIKEGKKKLTAEDLSKIEAQLEIIKNDTTELGEMKGTIKNDFQAIKDEVKNKSFQDAEGKFDDIISIQNKRTEGLKKLSRDLDALVSIIQTAIANSTTA